MKGFALGLAGRKETRKLPIAGLYDEWLSTIQITPEVWLFSLLNKSCTTLLVVELKTQRPNCIYCDLHQIRIHGELNIWTAKGKKMAPFPEPSAIDVTVAIISKEFRGCFGVRSLIPHRSDSCRVCPKLLRVQCSSLAKRKFVLTSFSSATLSDLLSHKLYQLFRCFPSYGFKVLVRILKKLHGL